MSALVGKHGGAPVQVNIPATGAAGFAPPPPNPMVVTVREDGVTPYVTGNAALHEVGAPISAQLVAEQMAMARRFEQALPPLTFADSVTPGGAPLATDAHGNVLLEQPRVVAPVSMPLRIPGMDTPAAEPRIILTDQPTHAPAQPAQIVGPQTPAPAPTHAPAIPTVNRQALQRPPTHASSTDLRQTALRHAAERDAEVQQAVETNQPYRPASSAGDTPSRGLPMPVADPGKQIAGGFGAAMDHQYYPLDGSELRELVRGQMSVIDAQMENDMRFSMALTYPRVRTRVTVEVIAWIEDDPKFDQSFTIEKVRAVEKTPVEVARQRADECVFVLMNDRREIGADGTTTENAPNQTRRDLALPIPMKQAIETPQGRLIVDLPSLFNGARR